MEEAYRRALLQIGSQHPAWSQDPEDKLVRIFNDVTKTAREAVNAIGNSDDDKAEWCSKQLNNTRSLLQRVNDFLEELTNLGILDEYSGHTDGTHPDVINSLCDDVQDAVKAGDQYSYSTSTPEGFIKSVSVPD